MTGTVNTLSKEAIQGKVVEILQDMVQDWDLDFAEPIGSQTRIVEDLGFESVDLMQLMVAVEKAFSIRGLPYDEVLMEDGGYVTEITVGQLVDFLENGIKTAAVAS